MVVFKNNKLYIKYFVEKTMPDKDEKGITAKKEKDFSEWYNQLLQKAELIEYTDVSGCYILRPRAFAVWEKIREYFDKKIKEIGVKNAYFPLFIPESLLKKEEKHFKGFKAEVAWVTKGGESDLNDPLAVRPTSETIIHSTLPKWIRSYKDLPLRLNQWCNVVRWEFKHPTPFIRSREFLWQEGHSAFSDEKEADKEVHEILNYYAEIYEKLLAVPVIKGSKSKKETFAGADYTLSVETFLPNGKAIQGATSHYLGQNFSDVFNIKYSGQDEKVKLVHQTSWGISTRAIGIMLMMHSDNKGLVLPPNVAEEKIVIVPIFSEKDKEKVLKVAEKVYKELKEFNPIFDNREDYTPGWKFNEWELKGIPIRVEIGPKDVEKKQAVVVMRHDLRKENVKLDVLKEKIIKNLEAMHQELLDNAKSFIKKNTVFVASLKEMENAIKARKLVKGNWCTGVRCEEEIKEKCDGAKSLVIPFDEPMVKGKKCFNCNNDAKNVCYFAKSY